MQGLVEPGVVKFTLRRAVRTVITGGVLCSFVLCCHPDGRAVEPAAGSAKQPETTSPGAGKQQVQLTAEQRDAIQAALEEFNSLVGGWRGVGMPQRGSRKGAWLEKANWVWDFSQGIALKYEIDSGKLLHTARLTYDPATRQYRMQATFAEEEQRTYTGKLDGKRLTMESKPDSDGFVHQMVITRLNSKRTLVLHQRRRDGQQLLMRVAEVGYTREGTSLAVEGAGEPECIVTGGKGTTPVTYKGKTYYVCCSGCRQAFDEDPAGVIAEYQRKVARRKKAGKGG